MQANKVTLSGIRIGKWLLLVAAALFVMTPALIVGYEWGLNFFIPITHSSLTYSPVDLGELRPGEKRSFQCEIRNQGNRTLHLLPPVASCGCLSQNNGTTVLRPGESRKLRFRFQAPYKPEDVERDILLQTADVSGLFWRIILRAQVLAPVWAEPAEVTLTTDENGFAETTLLIHHDEATTLGKVDVKSSAIQLESLEHGDGVLPVKIYVSSDGVSGADSGSTAIDFSAAEDHDKTLLSVPVRWRPPSKLEWIPKIVTLQDFGSARGDLTLTMAIRGLSGDEASRLVVKPLKTWVRIDGQEFAGSIIQLRLVFDPSAMPERIDDEGILQLSLDNWLQETVLAVGKR